MNARDLTDDKSTLVQVMAWCHQATSHYLNQCWPRSPTPYGITRPQWVKSSPPGQNGCHFTGIFKCIFMNEKFCVLIWISLKFVPKGPVDNKPALVYVIAWHRTGTKPLPQAILTQFTEGRWVNCQMVTLDKTSIPSPSHLDQQLLALSSKTFGLVNFIHGSYLGCGTLQDWLTFVCTSPNFNSFQLSKFGSAVQLMTAPIIGFRWKCVIFG